MRCRLCRRWRCGQFADNICPRCSGRARPPARRLRFDSSRSIHPRRNLRARLMETTCEITRRRMAPRRAVGPPGSTATTGETWPVPDGLGCCGSHRQSDSSLGPRHRSSWVRPTSLGKRPRRIWPPIFEPHRRTAFLMVRTEIVFDFVGHIDSLRAWPGSRRNLQAGARSPAATCGIPGRRLTSGA